MSGTFDEDDLQLTSGSPCIDDGTDVTATGHISDFPELDYWDNEAPYGVFDMGAHEFQSP